MPKPAAAISRYLEALDSHRPKRGRKRTPESVAKRLAEIEGRIPAATAVQRLGLIQQRLDLERELKSMGATLDLAKLEDEFVKAAKEYSESRGISYTAWRELGVSADVLRRAGVARTRRTS